MAEYSVVISGPAGAATFDPQPQEVVSGDMVCWQNRTSDPHTIVIDNQSAVPPLPAPSWKSTSAYKVTAAVTYHCQDHPSEKGSITFKTVMLLMALLAGFAAAPAKAQVTCGDQIGGKLEDPAEVSSHRGTLVSAGEKQLIAFLKGDRATGAIQASNLRCEAQWVRTYRTDAPANQDPRKTPVTLPHPGPTIRAKVGDLVELTFLNLIDDINFPGTDAGECDQVPGNAGPVYPNSVDKMPNCFHGSVFTNVHYHGTHTSPNSTADNVFLEIVPSPRSENEARVPTVTGETVRDDFNDVFFRDCETYLNRDDAPQQWPLIWDDLPATYRKTQDELLKKFQPKLWQDNENAKKKGMFPQNYIGAFPYCFRLPVYKQAVFPPAAPAEQKMTHTAGAGAAEHDESASPLRPLMMGQSPGTHWYHAHKHGSTTLNVSNGMTGVMIIEGKYDEEINKNYAATGITKHVIVINQIGVTPRREGGTEARGGPYFSVNGRLQPYIEMKRGEVQMWRIANTASRSGLLFTLPAGMHWRQLALDGVQLTDANYVASTDKPFLLASGNRADLLVKAPSDAGQTVGITVAIDPAINGGEKDKQLLLNVKTGTTAQEMTFMDRSKTYWPPFLNDITDDEVKDHTNTIRFTTSGGGRNRNHTIDDKKFNGEVGALVLLNQAQEWKVVNESFGGTAIAHPFHIHINPFQVVEVFDPNAKLADGTTPVYTTGAAGAGQCHIDVNDKTTWKPCDQVKPPAKIWHDVYPIPAGNTFNNVQVAGYFKMRSRFVDYPGYFVLHCHILSHEDVGMMTVVEVAPLQPPMSHH
ncbi:MAG TPA: multicopper oxidase domain-containing protein [Thermoanaerobaculia bacterium]|nr:multicopper oxidase domain-containing protein [Thermoanaerobaculia bacterium]